MKFARKKFFDGFRDQVDPTVSQEQVDGLGFLLSEMEQSPFWGYVPQIAYALATVYHETAGSFQPVEEGYYLEEKHGKAFVKAFQKKLRYYPYFGRGYVQLTWKKNYQKAESVVGFDLVNHPENALKPIVAFNVMTRGMHQGWFTGKKLDDYIKGDKKDYVGARHIINGQDKAGLIAGYARSFEQILTVSTAADSATANASTSTTDSLSARDVTATPPQPPNTPDPTIEQNVAVVREEPLGFWSTLKTKIVTAFTGIGGATGLTTYAQQAQTFGLSNLFWERVFWIGMVGFIGWIVIEVIRWFFTVWQRRKRTNALVVANTSPNNSVTVIRPEEAAQFQKDGWVIIERK
jgi:hypothetical protein